MNQQLTENEIKKLLEHLNYPGQADIMQQKLFFIQTETIRQQRINDERVVEALMNISANHPSGSARKEANKTLKHLGITPPPINLKWANWLLIGFSAGLIPGLLLYALIYGFTEVDLGAVILICLGIPGGVIGAYLGRRGVKTTWIAAILGAILGAGLFVVFAISTCLFCQ
jgi:hypothetical protein